MKYVIIFLALILCTCKPRIPRAYRKMENRVERRERLGEREKVREGLDFDTVSWKWRPITDTLLLGTPKVIQPK